MYTVLVKNKVVKVLAYKFLSYNEQYENFVKS